MIDVGAVLAGGRSERMGRDKSGLESDDGSFLDRATRGLRDVFGLVLVVGGGKAPTGTVLVDDIIADRGPLAGIASAIEHVDRSIFVCPIDTPLLSSRTVGLLSKRQLRPGQARVARVDGRVQPVVGAYSSDLLPFMMAVLESEDRSMMAFLSKVPHLELVDITDGSLRNINTPQDYEALRSGLS
mgnify:CR=1 FL=1